MDNKQPSSFLYIWFGALTIGASLIMIYLLFVSGIFKVTFDNDASLLLVGVIYGISVFSVITLLIKWHEGPELAKAMQSHQMLTIANETLSELRQGFSAETCEKVAKLIHERSDVDALAITDHKKIIAFSGHGQEHHAPGTPIEKREIKRLKENGIVIFESNLDAGCPEKQTTSWTGVSVPFKLRGEQIGTLEFLYLTPKKLTQSRVAVARGLGELLSTQLDLSELEKQQAMAVSSELKALRAQINPHFLFNTLNTIAALCRTDPKTARRLIIRFAEFFRESLEGQSQYTTLDEELKYVDSYLVFEQARFGAKLQIDWEVDKEARKAMLPSLVLQPLVENAVKHGMAKDGPLHLMLRAQINDEHLLIKVEDDGVGIAPKNLASLENNSKGLGIGLTNVRERLNSLYGSPNLLVICSEMGRGTEVTLKIPTNGGTDDS